MGAWLHFVALHVAHYRVRYGDVSVEESLCSCAPKQKDDELAQRFTDRFWTLGKALTALATPEGYH